MIETGTTESEAPTPSETDARAFVVLEALDAGKPVRVIKADFKIGVAKLDKIRADEALRARWESYKAELKAWEASKRRRAICETVLETGSMAEASRRHGVTNVTVLDCLQREGMIDRIRTLRRVQADLFGYATTHHSLKVLPAMSDLATDEKAAGTSRAAAGDVVRKFQQGGDPTTVNVANAPGGVAIAGGNGPTMIALPKPPSEQDLPPKTVHELARLLLTNEPGGTARPFDPEDDDEDETVGRS